MRPLLPPAILIEEIPLSDKANTTVERGRAECEAILHGRDDRLLVIAGPCSIHDTEAARDYAARILPLAERHKDDLAVIMRVYFEKPRTVVGWKGLINDPNLDNTFEINQGLRLARQLLADIGDLGLPAGSEFLDTIIPQFVADATSWAAIGARTTESQVHRELASGLSMPVGFKNGTGGNIQMAVDAARSARESHWFPSVTKQGVTAIFQTSGNPYAHVILRGGERTGPNFSSETIRSVCGKLESLSLPPRLLVDCSHGNSEKDYRRQSPVARDLASQISAGETGIAGVMLESHIMEGKQKYHSPGGNIYGQSITDACIGIEETEALLEELAQAIRSRRSAVA